MYEKYASPVLQGGRTLPHNAKLVDKFGICQWFHYQAYEDVWATIEVLQDLGIKHLRTGISWADFLRPQGKQWYTWQMRTLAAAGFHILLSVWHVPPTARRNLLIIASKNCWRRRLSGKRNSDNCNCSAPHQIPICSFASPTQLYYITVLRKQA